MMHAVVSPGREIRLALRVRGPGGTERDVSTVIDTGFNGYLTLPSLLVQELELPYVSHVVGTLADGSVAAMDTVQGDDHVARARETGVRPGRKRGGPARHGFAGGQSDRWRPRDWGRCYARRNPWLVHHILNP